MEVQAGTALGEAEEVRWGTIRLQRGGMLLMVSTSRHHGMLALLDSKDGLHGALFNLWNPDARNRHHQPEATHLDPPPPARPWPLLRICRPGAAPPWTTCCGRGRGWLGGWGCGRWVLPRPSSRTPRRRSWPPPPTCPDHPTFLPRSAPATDLALIEIAQYNVLFSVGTVHQIEICKGRNVDPESEIHFAISGVAPPGAADHVVAPPQNRPSVAAAEMLEGWGMVTDLPM